jgi:hypothetical protein
MKMYSYLVEGLPDGRWRWTVFGDDNKAVRSGTSKEEDKPKVAARNSIDELKKLTRKKTSASRQPS